MKITDLNLLEVEIYDNSELIYQGMCEEVPNSIKEKHIQIIGIDGKKLKLKVESV